MGSSTSLLLEDSNANIQTPIANRHINTIETSDTFHVKPKLLNLLIVSNAYPANRQTTSIQIEHTSTIQQLKHKIATILKLKIESICLSIPNLKPLNKDELTLSDYDISNGQIITVQIRLNNQMKPIVYFNGNQLKLNNLDSHNTILHLKTMIAKMHSIPIISQKLYVDNGKMILLEDSKLLRDLSTAFIHLQMQSTMRNLFSLTKSISLTAPNLHSEYASLIAKFNETMPSTNTEIVGLYRIEKNFKQNLMIYNNLLKTMENKTQRILFHGTSVKNMEKIILNGFNRDYNKRCLYGKGTYFTNAARTASIYSTKDDSLGFCGMLVCNVIVGNYGLGRSRMSDSSLYKSDGVQQYDSLVNDLRNPTIFVINRDYHAVPLCVILFKKRSVQAGRIHQNTINSNNNYKYIINRRR